MDVKGRWETKGARPGRNGRGTTTPKPNSPNTSSDESRARGRGNGQGRAPTPPLRPPKNANGKNHQNSRKNTHKKKNIYHPHSDENMMEQKKDLLRHSMHKCKIYFHWL